MKGLVSEFDIRPQDWAGALIIPLTVLLAFDGSMLGDASNRWWVLTDAIFGLMGTIWVVFWYSKEGFWQIKKRPVLLLLGSVCFGVQITLFLISLVLKQVGSSI
jgi:membrane associated rhomboid family serine protease